MIWRKILNTLIPLISILLITGLSQVKEAHGSGISEQESLMKKANSCVESLYRSSKLMKYRHNWMKCIDQYKNIHEKFPKSEEAPWALYKTAKMFSNLYRYSGLEADLDNSLAFYEKVVKEYGNHRLADDAQYKIGEIYYLNKKNPTQAYVEFLKVDIKFPSGDMGPKAREMMDKLSLIISKNEESEESQKPPADGNALTAVKNIRYWSTPSYTRVVIDLERPVEYSSHLLKEDLSNNKPRRLYLDLEKTYVGSDIDTTIPIKDGLLQTARAAQFNQETVRVVLDINNIGSIKTFRLHDPFRIVVDVRGDEKKTAEKQPSLNTVPRPPRKGVRIVEKPDETVSLARQLGLSVKRIVIDPGHGGRDPGCDSTGGVMEKNIVLDLAKKLSDKIKKDLGCEVLLTRDKDISVPLDERTAFANVKKADLFISLHVNAHKQTNIFGVETYFLNMATDQRAVMVAARENATSEKNISDLQSILNDLMLNTKINESSRLAHQVQEGIMGNIEQKYKTAKSLGVKQAPFYVLIGAEMPAILIETGFITNSLEKKRLLNEKYRDIIADGIFRGIDSYIKSIDLVYKGG